MANLAFSNQEPWDEVHHAMTKHILDQTDGAFEIKQQSGAVCVYAEGSDTLPEGPAGYRKIVPSSYKEGADLPVRFMGWRCIYYNVPHGFLELMFKEKKK
tara:strand:+ start:5314 stop:5613 length:300 start_codon:yes stop_codon:yes gene_type:complete